MKHAILRCGGRRRFSGFEQLAANQPANAFLHSALRQTGEFRHCLMAGRYRAAPQFFRLRSQVEIDQKRGGHPVMPDQITHQDGEDVIIESYSITHYSSVAYSQKNEIDDSSLFP